MIVLDTDHLSELQRANSVKRRVKLRRSVSIPRGDRPVATTIVISSRSNCAAGSRTIHRRPAGSRQVVALRPIDSTSLSSTAGLARPPVRSDRRCTSFHDLKAAKIRIGTMDLKIAAIVLVTGATLLSANLRDFRQVPGLAVEDWLS